MSAASGHALLTEARRERAARALLNLEWIRDLLPHDGVVSGVSSAVFRVTCFFLITADQGWWTARWTIGCS